MALEFKNFSVNALNAALGGTVAVMAAGSFELVATGALMYAVGVHVLKGKADEVGKSIEAACEVLAYGKSSKYALVNASKSLAVNLCKAKGFPNAAIASQFWQDVAAGDIATGVALVIAYVKTDLGVENMRDLTDALAGKPKVAKEPKPILERAIALIDKDGDDPIALVTGLVAHYGITSEVLAALVRASEDKAAQIAAEEARQAA